MTLAMPMVSFHVLIQPGGGPSRGLLRDCENFADGSFAALYWILHCGYKLGHEDTWILSFPFTIDMTQDRKV